MKIKEILDRAFYVLVCPDGEIQLNLLSPQKKGCEALIRMLHCSGLGRCPEEMKKEGFVIKKIYLSILNNKQTLKNN